MAKLRQSHLLVALAFLLFSVVVRAQWPWAQQGGQAAGTNNAAEDNEDDDDLRSGTAQQQNQWPPAAGGGRNQPRPISSTPKAQPSPWNLPWSNPNPPQPQQPWPPQAPWLQPPSLQPRPQPQPQPQPKPQPRPQPRPQPQPPAQPPAVPWEQPWATPKPPQQPSPPRTVTVTKGTPPKTQQPPPVPTAPSNNPPVSAQPTASRSKTWSQPSQWGPSRSPFGPNATPSGPQTIATTTSEAHREPVPFLTTCGRSRYVEYDVSNALVTGCYYKNKTKTVNKSEFPKPFINNFGFNFGDTKPPYWEFPLIDSAAYIGGPSGPDRVIFNDQCFLAGEITQTNAGARQWTECIENY